MRNSNFDMTCEATTKSPLLESTLNDVQVTSNANKTSANSVEFTAKVSYVADNASGPEIKLPGRISAGFQSGRL